MATADGEYLSRCGEYEERIRRRDMEIAHKIYDEELKLIEEETRKEMEMERRLEQENMEAWEEYYRKKNDAEESRRYYRDLQTTNTTNVFCSPKTMNSYLETLSSSDRQVLENKLQLEKLSNSYYDMIVKNSMVNVFTSPTQQDHITVGMSRDEYKSLVQRAILYEATR